MFSKLNYNKMIELNNPHRSLIKRMILDNYYHSTTTSVLQHEYMWLIYLLAT